MSSALPRGNPQNIALGPGMLLIAPLGSTEPVDLTSAWPAVWLPSGYTNEGSSFAFNPTFEPVDVAEELEPIDSVATGREQTVTFAAAEQTHQNWQRALNGGTIVLSGTGADTISTYEPPNLGEEVYRMIGFESEDHQERWIWRKCKQTGSIETTRRKGAEKAVIPMTYSIYKPDDGSKSFRSISKRGVTPA